MTNILGPYYSPWHWRGEDEDYMRQLDPAWVNIHQPTARAIETVQRCAPNARIMLRSWDIDDHNGDRKREMYADPRGAARKHLEMWKTKWAELVAEMRRNGWQPNESVWYLGMVNEPDPAFVRQMVEYSLEACDLVRGTLIRLGLVASSVGTFQKPSEGDQGWAQCIPLEKPINDGGHILLVHEYWRSGGPNYGEDGGNLAWRHRSIPLDVPILIRESGANGYIYQEHTKDDDSGWQKIVAEPKPETYAAQVKEYIEGCDQRVKGVLLYMLDFHSDQWKSFDTQPAMRQLLAIKEARPQVPSPFAKDPVETRFPSVIAPGPTPVEPKDWTDLENWFDEPKAGSVIATVLNARRGPGLDYPVVRRLIHGERVTADVEVERTGHSWVRVGAEEWVSDAFLAWGESASLPTGDLWARVWPIVLKIEGGLSLDPNDPGNWRNGRLVGTKFGISARTWGHLYDIPNLTEAQALTIYKEHYWHASGADQMPWPMCLIHFDTAVQHSVGVANQLLNYTPSAEEQYLGQRALRYMDDSNWRLYGEAWGVRVDHLQDIAKGRIDG